MRLRDRLETKGLVTMRHPALALHLPGLGGHLIQVLEGLVTMRHPALALHLPGLGGHLIQVLDVSQVCRPLVYLLCGVGLQRAARPRR